MQEACVAIASLKNWLDMRLPDKDMIDRFLYHCLIRERSLDQAWNSRGEGERKVLNGEIFVRHVLPFSDPFYTEKKASLQSVDPHSVLGGNYARSEQDISYEEAVNLADALDEASREGDPSAAHYIKVGPFDLYVASEGKNRVQVYRRLDREIVARVSKCDFPAAEELVLRRVAPWSNIVALECTASGHRWVEGLHRHQIVNQSRPNVALLPYVESVNLLESYGVAWGDAMFSLAAPLQLRKLRMLIGHHYYVR